MLGNLNELYEIVKKQQGIVPSRDIVTNIKDENPAESILNTTLKKYTPGSKSNPDNWNIEYTNSSMGQSTEYSIPSADYFTILQKATEQVKIMNENPEAIEHRFCLDEKFNGSMGEKFKLFMDLDIKVREDHPIMLSDSILNMVLLVIVRTTSQYFPKLKNSKYCEQKWDLNKAVYDQKYMLWYGGWQVNNLDEDYFQTEDGSRLNVLVCTSKKQGALGVHLYWIGGIIVNHVQILTIRHNIVCELKRLNQTISEISDLDWEKIVDREVYTASKIGMRMIYSNKFELCKTCKGSGAFRYDSIDTEAMLKGTASFDGTNTFFQGKNKKRACITCLGKKGFYSGIVYSPGWVIDMTGKIIDEFSEFCKNRTDSKVILDQICSTSIRVHKGFKRSGCFYETPRDSIEPNLEDSEIKKIKQNDSLPSKIMKKSEFRNDDIEILNDNNFIIDFDELGKKGLSWMNFKGFEKYIPVNSPIGQMIESELKNLDAGENCDWNEKLFVKKITVRQYESKSKQYKNTIYNWTITVIVDGTTYCSMKGSVHSGYKIYFKIKKFMGLRKIRIEQACHSGTCKANNEPKKRDGDNKFLTFLPDDQNSKIMNRNFWNISRELELCLDPVFIDPKKRVEIMDEIKSKIEPEETTQQITTKEKEIEKEVSKEEFEKEEEFLSELNNILTGGGYDINYVKPIKVKELTRENLPDKIMKNRHENKRKNNNSLEQLIFS